ncbi:MAG: hypothetical protein V4696_12065 [Pseudomonadota bacterium]
MGGMFDNIFDDLRENPRLALRFKVAAHHRGGALRIEDEAGKLLGHVEQVDWQDETANLWAASGDLYGALKQAVETYGKPGGPWNVPSDPGGWLDRSRDALHKAEGLWK